MVTRFNLLVVLSFLATATWGAQHSCAAVSALIEANVHPAEIQKFEQSYETWVQTLTQTVTPSIPVTVLVDLSYSNSQEKLEDYEDSIASNHLPGLPDVVDPHYNHPSESPLFTLVTQQKIKVLFEGQLNSTQKKVLTEILTNKLRINAKRGDRITLQEVNTSVLNQMFQSRKRQAAGIIFIVLAIAAFGAVQRRRIPTLKAPKFAIDAEKISIQITKMNSKLNWMNNKGTIDPIQFILKSDAKILISVVRKEKALALAHVIQGVSDAVVATILKLCSREQRNEIKSLLIDQKMKFDADQIKYQQLLLAAKVHREAQKVNQIAAQMEKLVSIQEQRAEEEQKAMALKTLILTPEAKEEAYEDQNISI